MIATLLTIGALIWGGYKSIGNDIECSRGTNVGKINRFSEKGFVWKGYGGQLAVEETAKSSLTGTAILNFSIDNAEKHSENKQELIEEITKYMKKKERVKISYIQILTTWP